MTTHRAYSVLDIKMAGDKDGKRTFSGIATTPSVDRGGDIVEPKGAEFQLPIPLLWQHDARAPIGWITQAKVTDKGIEVTGEIASIDEPGNLRDRLEEAWQSMRAKLVRGLSIGFKPLESARIGDTYAYRYSKWMWLELSAVTIPMNGDCSITAIKSADQATRRAATGARPVLRLKPEPAASGNQIPGDSGQQTARRKGVLYLN
jgi:HK97 family phage prohead protease